MDKNAIKRFAVWARRELISRVSQRAALYEITDKGYGDASADSVLGRVMSAEEKRQRQALIAQIREKGFEQVMEEIAYTWFNRFIALRFMEVNGYLPSHVRVFTDDDNNFRPQILSEAINMELDGLDMEKVYALKNANDDDALFKYMIIVQCNALSSILPGMFQHISDFSELLFPDNLLREGSVIEQMVSMIPEEDWTDQVQIIGWLYQYYNIEPKDTVFAKKGKIKKEEVPAATQLFTPDWIVRYMVENSLGRIWLEGHPNDELKSSWKYYLDDAEQDANVQVQLGEIRKEYAALKPEDILVVDPCQGSGHILVYMFDVLVQIYETYGYTTREAISSIISKNLWGLDLDERATQLAYFSVMMKARQYDKRFLSRGIQPHIYSICESNSIDYHCIEYFSDGRSDLKAEITRLINAFHDAKEYGSILILPQINYELLLNRIEEIQNEETLSLYSLQSVEAISPLIDIGKALSQKYHVVVTNPPYMSVSSASPKLDDYVRTHYKDGKADMYAVFMMRCNQMTVHDGFQAMITQHGWMFLGSFEKLRCSISHMFVVNMAHLGARAFEEIAGEVVQTTSFVLRKREDIGAKGVYERLVDYPSQDGKEQAFLSHKNQYSCSNAQFHGIPGTPFAYWISKTFAQTFSDKLLADYAQTKQGFATGSNDLFLRFWYETSKANSQLGSRPKEEARSSNMKWFPCNKGGSYRKWYGNNTYLANWENDGSAMRQFSGSVIRNPQFYFREGITWSSLANQLSLRYSPEGFIFESKGSMCYPNDSSTLLYLLGLLNSKTTSEALSVLSPTLDFHEGPMSKVPVVLGEQVDTVSAIVRRNIDICKEDWDAFETSWDFAYHPMLPVYADDEYYSYSLEAFYRGWEGRCQRRFNQLKENEEELNQIFIETYGLQDELSPDVHESDVTVRKSDLQRDIKSLISFAVGCMFGRYNLWHAGLAYAGGEWDASQYDRFPADKDNVIPICDDEYFEDDVVGRFVEFMRIAYGERSLEDNLRFVADALGGKGASREVIRDYFINDFYADHLKIYQKRPIYWLFDSGKKNGFKCLIYMHRYQPDTIARIRTDYVHEQQSRYRTAIADLESRIANAGTSERVKLSKQLTKLQEQAEELRVYEEKIHHLADQMIRIDLDDGVKHNYAIFQDVLAKIK